MNRDDEYYDLKRTIAAGMIDLVYQKNPGFKELIDHVEASTPITSEYFSAHKQGIIYGHPGTPHRYKQKLIGSKTPLKNLYMVGADVFASGIVPALLSGLATAIPLNGLLGYKKFKHFFEN